MRKPHSIALMVLLRLAVTTVLASSLNACSAVGLGVGAAFPRYEQQPSGQIAHVELCPAARLEFARSPSETYEVDAMPLQSDASKLRMQLEDGSIVTSSWSDIRTTSCRSGSYWWLGLGLGLAVDVAVLAVLAANAPYTVSGHGSQ